MKRLLNLIPVRKILAFGMLSGLMLQLKAQTEVPPPVFTPYSISAKVNAVRTWSPKGPFQYPSELITKPVSEVEQTTEYYDGLGRFLQKVIKQGARNDSGRLVDFVTPVQYDAYGREAYQFLPFAANNINGVVDNDGLFKINPYQQLNAFGAIQYPGEQVYYGYIKYENSPLKRPEKTYMPGNSWAGSDRGVRIQHWLNKNTDSVKIWKVENVAGNFASGKPNANGTYDQKDELNPVTPSADRDKYTQGGGRLETHGGKRRVEERNYNKKNAKDKNSSRSKYNKAAERGIRIVNPEEIKDILKELGLTQ